ncbi:MAG: TetR/AcrR family transcriptional regulator [Alphaproteobacteria bacterium]|nr:TetR/AcrR family transcriptional regulator [Alphaproteobacteria bacterium]MBV9903535.1 TetR/AcrR family transcriptional regulator [Alphaproteobacteria bacterium]
MGLRTVFRHFENMESLYREMNEAIAGEVLPIWQKPPTGADWRENFAEMLDRRTAIFEAILPLKVAADVHRHTSPFLEAETRRLVRMQREGLLRVLPAERREDKTLVEALDLTLSFDSWRRLRRDQKLSRDTARAVVARMADILLAS